MHTGFSASTSVGSVVSQRASIFEFPRGWGGPQRYSIHLAATRKNNLAKLFYMCAGQEKRQIEHFKEYAQKAVCEKNKYLCVQISFTELAQAGSEKGM